MAIKIAIANLKGGIGKTTTALCLSDLLSKRGKKVLLIDTDPQRSATGVYGASTDGVATLADIMYDESGTIDASECIQHLPLGDIIASDNALRESETKIKTDADRFYHLIDGCKNLDDKYDFIILDCPPGNGVMLGNVLSYANYVIMPTVLDKFGIEGMADFSDVMRSYTRHINPNLRILGVLIIKYKGRQSLTRDLEDNLLPAIIESMSTKVFDTKIRESVKCQEAQALKVSLYDYAPTCTTAEDYISFTDELLKELKQ